jgi:CRP/FNR family transcriptional regulator
MDHKPPAPVIDLSTVKVACRNCSLHQLCLPMGISPADLEKLERIVERSNPLGRGEYLFRSGDRFHSIYAVKSGSVKTATFSENGHEEIAGFHLPGELFGLDAIDSGIHHCSARALERSLLCEIPFASLEQLSAELPSLMRQMLRIMSREIQQEQGAMQLGRKSAEARLATFLLDLSQRLQARGFAGDEFRLSMSRYDIGNYLGLAVETVSRLLTRFQDQGLMQVEWKQITLLDLPRLAALASGNADSSPSRRQRG